MSTGDVLEMLQYQRAQLESEPDKAGEARAVRVALRTILATTPSHAARVLWEQSREERTRQSEFYQQSWPVLRRVALQLQAVIQEAIDAAAPAQAWTS